MVGIELPIDNSAPGLVLFWVPPTYDASAPLLYETTIKTIIKKTSIDNIKEKITVKKKKKDEHRILGVKSIIKFAFSYFLPLCIVGMTRKLRDLQKLQEFL